VGEGLQDLLLWIGLALVFGVLVLISKRLFFPRSKS
jgi:hypothetical protein